MQEGQAGIKKNQKRERERLCVCMCVCEYAVHQRLTIICPQALCSLLTITKHVVLSALWSKLIHC